MNELTQIPPTLDECEAQIAKLPNIECPVKHHFFPGLYVREILLPKGAILTSKIHNTEHPYLITSGKVCVYIDGGKTEELTGPHFGTTYPGTRRMIYAFEDTIWFTFHPTNKTTPEEVEEEIIMKHTNPLLKKENIQIEEECDA